MSDKQASKNLNQTGQNTLTTESLTHSTEEKLNTNPDSTPLKKPFPWKTSNEEFVKAFQAALKEGREEEAKMSNRQS